MPSPGEVAELYLPLAGSVPVVGESGSASAGGSGGSLAAAATAGGTGNHKGRPSMGATEDSMQPFILSEVLAPVPARLVAKIVKGDFVDMAELLRDNLEAQRRGSQSDTEAAGAGQLKRSRCEIPDLLS